MKTLLKPIHPGVFLAELLEEYSLTQYALAKALGVQPIRIGEIVRGRRSISPETALRLARYFGTDAQSWLNWQSQYDLALAQSAVGREIWKSVQPTALAA